MKSTSAKRKSLRTSLDRGVQWRFCRVRAGSSRCAAIRRRKNCRCCLLACAAPKALTLRSRLPMRWSLRPRSSTSARSMQIFGPDGEDIVFTGEYRARPAASR